MKKIFAILLGIIAISSCDHDTTEPKKPATSGTFILNNGNWGDNDSSIGIYDTNGKTYFPDVFSDINGVSLGDLGQDIIIFGDEIYIAVNGSQTIFVTDKFLKIKERINAEKDGERLSPRYFAASGHKIYVSYYEGYVGEIDPATHSVRITETGPNPECMTIAGNKLYVADSGGLMYPSYNNTLSEISLDTFTRTGTYNVGINPVKVVSTSDGAMLYIFSYGDFSSIPSRLQTLDLKSGTISDLGYSSITSIAKGDNDILYILCGGYDSQWNPLPGEIYAHNMAENTMLGKFISDGSSVPDAYSISVASDGHIYVGSSDYRTTGDMYVFTPEGKLYDIFDTQGLNPISAY